MQKTLFYDFLIILTLLLIFIIGFFGGYYYYFTYEQDIIFNQLKKNVEEKNLTLLDEQTITGKYYSDYDLETYHNYVVENYFYEKNNYNCKYWSLNLATYLQKHNIDYKFITTSNHILVVAYNNSSYTILDGNIKCTINLN